MKRTRTYMVLGTAVLLFISSGWAAERDVISFVSVTDRTRPIIFMNTQGKILQRLVIPGLKQLSLSWSPDGNSFAYHTHQNGNFDIYVMDVETHTHRQLTFDGGKDLWPAWSPNGKWISFASDRAGTSDLYRIDISGGNLIKLTDGHRCNRSAWSPDSQWIAFTSETSLFVMSAEGGRLRHLAANAHRSDCAWSPDGEQIAFASNAGIFSIDVNGKNLRQLTGLGRQALIWELAWSPSGEWIVYRLVEILGGLGGVVEFGGPVLWVVNTTDNDGGKPIETTGEIGASYLDWVPEVSFTVSPSEEKQTTLWGSLKQEMD